MTRFPAIILSLILAAWGCASRTAPPGPPAPDAAALTAVVVTPVNPPGPDRVIRDPARLRALATSFAFSATGWSKGDDRGPAPAYRIVFQGRSRSTTYWLGAFPPAVSVPIYIYSTWWVSPSTRAGRPDRTRQKGLADTVRFRLFHDLGL